MAVAAPGILVNDSDPGNDHDFTPVLVSTTSNGALTLDANGDGGFTYTPNHNFVGTDSFTYQDQVGSVNHTLSNIATVTINVGAQADLSTAIAFATPPAYVDQGGSLNFLVTITNNGPSQSTGFTAQLSTDPNGIVANSLPAGVSYNALSNTISSTFSMDSGAQLMLNFTGTVAANYSPATVSESVALQTEAQSDPNSANNMATTAAEAVNHAPTDILINGSHSATIARSGAANITVGNLSDVDPDSGDTGTFILITNPNGAYSINGSNQLVANSALVDWDTATSDTVQVQVTDKGGLTDTVNLTINLTNETATAGNDSYNTTSNVPLAVAAPGILANDSDPGNDHDFVPVLVTGPTYGTLNLDANGDGGFTYTPNTGFAGSDSFTYQDQVGTVNKTLSNIATVTLNVINPAADLSQQLPSPPHPPISTKGELKTLRLPSTTLDQPTPPALLQPSAEASPVLL